jgi:hypothetical protein
MRGLMFTEYFDFVGSLSDEDVADDVLNELGDSVTGAYTSVGNYSFDEFAKLHGAISKRLEIESSELARKFGHWLMGRFAVLFPDYLTGVDSGLDFLEKTGAHIHVEVRKLYPDASPPEVVLERIDDNSCKLHYKSHRPLAPVALGLTEACLAHFNDRFRVVNHSTVGDETTFELEAA